jgi:hypothetical protein
MRSILSSYFNFNIMAQTKSILIERFKKDNIEILLEDEKMRNILRKITHSHN